MLKALLTMPMEQRQTRPRFDAYNLLAFPPCKVNKSSPIQALPKTATLLLAGMVSNLT
jgi:hypothetical protein